MVRIGVTVLILVLGGVLVAAAVEKRGAALINIDGGTRGKVPFPHHRHQDLLGDCNVCHTHFPQEQGGIARFKKEGRLITKQVMVKHCIKCHKANKGTGNATGPTTCAKCHVKEKKKADDNY